MSESQPLKASLWMIGSITSFTAMAIAARAAANELDTFEMMLYRSAIGLAIVVALAAVTGTLSSISGARPGLHILRNGCHFAGQNLWLFAVTVAPLAQVFALEFSSPLWAMFLAVPLLGERLTRLRVAMAFLGFLGVLIVTRPWQAELSPGIMAAALAAICFAGTAVFTRRLTRHEEVVSIMFWLTGLQLLFGVICAGYDGHIAWPSLAIWPAVLTIALSGLIAHFCLTTALSLAPAAIVMPVDFIRLPIIAAVGFVLYDEALSLWIALGAALIFGANYVTILSETRTKRPADAT